MMHEVENSLDRFRVGNSYETEQFIGYGTTGVVYRGKNISLDTPVAIKILNPELSKNDKFMQFLNNEIKAVFKLNHPNIVNVKETGCENEKFYIIMEFVEGRSLDEILKEKGHFSITETVEILKQLALAIDYANSNDVIHKAIKPHNILLSTDNHVKLTGFGLSKAMATAWLTITGTSAAHVEYMSPEQAEGEKIDQRCDIYSFGIIGYQLLAGEVPFRKEGSSILNLAMKHINIIPDPPSQKNSGIPQWLEVLVLKCLEKKPENRFQSGQEIYDALKKGSGFSLPADKAGLPKAHEIEVFQDLSLRDVSAEELQLTLNEAEDNEIIEKIRKSYSEKSDKTEVSVQKEKPDIIENVVSGGLPSSSLHKNQKQLKLLLFVVILLELVIISIFLFILFTD